MSDSVWSTKTIRELGAGNSSTVQTGPFGSQLHAEDYVEEGVPFILIRNIGDGGLKADNLPRISVSDAKRLAKYSLNSGDIVFTRVGRAGSCLLVTDKESGWIISGQTLRLRLDNPELDSRFFLYALRSHTVQKFVSNSSVGTTRESLNTKILKSIPVLHPGYIEQKRIAEILSTVDEAIEQTEALIAKYQHIKAGLMHDLFTRGVTSDGHLRPIRAQAPHLYKESPLGWIPKEWDTVRLDKSEINIIDGDRGENYPQGHELLDSGYCLFLSATNVTPRGFKFDQLQFISSEKDHLLGTGKLVRGDIIITTRGTVGNIAFFDDDVPFSEIRINSGMVILRCNQSNLAADFLYCSFANYIFGQEFKRVVSGSAQPQLPIKDLKHFHCLVLPMPEQQLLLSRVRAVDGYLSSEEESLNKLSKAKKGLMQDLLTGRVRVKVGEAEEKL